ncbi:MAG: hypothetical protein MK180_08425 [Rhodobacteraceae bacterium]|nr:hypothetical protein [Paracoccaceae bacterium]
MVPQDRIEDLKRMHNALLHAKAHGYTATAAAFEALLSATLPERAGEKRGRTLIFVPSRQCWGWG